MEVEANLCLPGWDEWRREMLERRRRRWRERVRGSFWVNDRASDLEEEEDGEVGSEEEENKEAVMRDEEEVEERGEDEVEDNREVTGVEEEVKGADELEEDGGENEERYEEEDREEEEVKGADELEEGEEEKLEEEDEGESGVRYEEEQEEEAQEERTEDENVRQNQENSRQEPEHSSDSSESDEQDLLDWDEWRRKMLEKRRRRRWSERVRGSCSVNVRASDQEEEEEDKEVGSEEEEEEEVREGKEEKENDEGEMAVMRDEDEVEERGEDEVGMEVEEENNREVIGVDMEEEEVNGADGQMSEGKEEEAGEEKEEVENKDSLMRDEEEVEEQGEDEGEDNREVNGVDVEEEEVNEADELEEEEGENEERYEEEDQEEEEVKEADELEEGEEEEAEEEEENEIRYEEEDQEEREDENVRQNQENSREEPEYSSDLSESDEEDMTKSEEDFYNLETEDSAVEKRLKDLEDPKEKPPEERKYRFEKLSGSQVDPAVFEWEEEEETTDDEETGHSADEEVDEDDEVKTYRKDDHHSDIFRTLTEFRDSSVLTDLVLNTEDGASFHVHYPVLAAVSVLIRERLGQTDDGLEATSRRSVSLGPEVDRVGLKAVVDFAYGGLIPCLNGTTWRQIKAAAEALGVSRVLELCKEEESTKIGGTKEEDEIPAEEQMKISLQAIQQLQADRVGCDVILEAVGGSLHVHRVIVAVCSDYFRGMFTSGMRESHQPHVALPFLLASELEVLFDCSYSGKLPLSWKSVFEITTTALQLQHQPALSLCLDFMHRELNPDSCLDVASFAEAYEMLHLLEAADDFVLRQFQKVSCISKFKDLPAKKLFRYLTSRSLCVASELVVFKAVVAWIQAKPRIRVRLAKELMKAVNFPLMTFKEFKEVRSLNLWSDPSLRELYEAVFEDFCSNEGECRVYLPKESLVLVGGDQITEDWSSRSISRDLWFGNSLRNHMGVKKDTDWRKLGEMPEPERFKHEVAVLKGKLYVMGGKKYYGICDTLKSVYRFDLLQNIWENLADMQEERCSFAVVVLDEKIYAIGGHCDPEYIQTVERYCPSGNSWSLATPLDIPLGCHVAKVLRGSVFVSGGQSSNNQYLSSMFQYHPATGSTYLANMLRPRAHHCMEVLGERLYVAGGITVDQNVSISDQLACEVYDPTTDSWTPFASLPVPHVGAAGAVLEGKFYVLGGYSQEDYTDTRVVHRYDATTQRWENMGRMPGPNNDLRASVLCLPPHFRL